MKKSVPEPPGLVYPFWMGRLPAPEIHVPRKRMESLRLQKIKDLEMDQVSPAVELGTPVTAREGVQLLSTFVNELTGCWQTV